MGRSIGGFFVGLISGLVVATILGLVLMFAVGTKGMVQGENYEPTMLWILASLAMGLIWTYAAAAIARLVSKNKLSTYFLLGLILILSIWGIVSGMGEKPPVPEQMPEPSMDMQPWIANFYAQRGMPAWFAFASSFAAILGTCLGGFNKGDFASTPEPPSEQPGT
jgi:hypothetical protein